jgi:hypothetical protein
MKGGEMTQTLYAHMNKIKNRKIYSIYLPGICIILNMTSSLDLEYMGGISWLYAGATYFI